MPPRNSNTKPFKKYNVKIPTTINNVSVNVQDFVKTLVNENVFENEDHKSFMDFKADEALRNETGSIKYKKPDPRYEDTDWFKKNLKERRKLKWH